MACSGSSLGSLASSAVLIKLLKAEFKKAGRDLVPGGFPVSSGFWPLQPLMQEIKIKKRPDSLVQKKIVCCFVGCFASKRFKQVPGYEDPAVLAAETPFTVSEVKSLYELFRKLSSSIFDDGLIHKEELNLALFRNQNKRNLFADRIFDMFDRKRNGVIEFGEFVRSLGVFHPNAPTEEKITFAFRLYDLRQTGFIEREELKEMVLALLNESELVLSEDFVETIVDKTFIDADMKGDGKIDQEEWRDFVSKNPSLIKNMTLPYLKDITLVFPSFSMSSDTENQEREND